MGACRGLNLALGIAAAPPALVLSWPLTLLPLGYITGVTALSRGEVAGGRRPVAVAALGLVAVVLVALASLAIRAPRLAWWALLLTAVLAWRILPPLWRAVRTLAPDAIRRAVRAGVLSLVLLDAVIAAVYADMIVYSLVVLATAVLAGWLARRFAVT